MSDLNPQIFRTTFVANLIDVCEGVGKQTPYALDVLDDLKELAARYSHLGQIGSAEQVDIIWAVLAASALYERKNLKFEAELTDLLNN